MGGCCHFRHSRTCRSSDPGQPDPGPFQAGHGAQCGLCRKASPGLLTHCVLSFPEPGPLPLPLRVSGFRTSLPRVLGLRPPGSFPGPAWSPRSAQGIHESHVPLLAHFAHLWFLISTQREQSKHPEGRKAREERGARGAANGWARAQDEFPAAPHPPPPPSQKRKTCWGPLIEMAFPKWSLRSQCFN